MLLLEGLKQAFGSYPQGSIKQFLTKQRDKLGDEEFCMVMCNWFGGRTYNVFLDYKLLAIKLYAIFKYDHNIQYYDKEHSRYLNVEIVSELFFDDRHDMYQNIPYYIDDLIKLNPDKKEKIYNIFAYALIDCFNVNGTGDKFSEEVTVKEY